ncbi:hypothetical protein JRO89_XS03G0054000 [Xanthoceras sorbifolium]|uniref:Uncharacterized protein n=1 Tax=Xanthoceras sorbifolium TaxID=99658 RepID=A0ABQ8I8T8_9ROSI|nr:hypothetical protein JRO89_XS03G0054000 [Xanthoceras sorbifolium]
MRFVAAFLSHARALATLAFVLSRALAALISKHNVAAEVAAAAESMKAKLHNLLFNSNNYIYDYMRFIVAFLSHAHALAALALVLSRALAALISKHKVTAEVVVAAFTTAAAATESMEAKVDRIEDALHLFNQMEDSGLIRGLLNEGQLDLSKDVIDQMTRASVGITLTLHNFVSETFGQVGRGEKIDRFLNPDKWRYTVPRPPSRMTGPPRTTGHHP